MEFNKDIYSSGEDDLWQWAKDHELAEGGVRAIGSRPEDSKYFDSDNYISGTPQSTEIIRSVANLAVPGFDTILENITKDPNQMVALEQAKELLAASENLVVVSNHADLKDIAVAQAAVLCLLGVEQSSIETGIVINKMVKYLEFEVGQDFANAVDVLQILENHIYLTIPNSISTAKRNLMSLRKKVPLMKKDSPVSKQIASRLERGSQLLAIAPSGTTDKIDENGTKILHTVKPKTIDMIKHDSTHVLPIAANLRDKEHPTLKIIGRPTQISDDSDLHHIMHRLAAEMTNSTDQPHRYNQY